MTVALGLDVGDKRVGVAISDQLGLTASPVDTFVRAKGRAEQEILKLAQLKKISVLVVGMPLSEDGAKNEQCLKVENFCRRLKKRLNVELVFVDEYLTSFESQELIQELEKNRKIAGKKERIDALSACKILQQFLDSRRLI